MRTFRRAATAGPDDETLPWMELHPPERRDRERAASLPEWLQQHIARSQRPWGLVAAVILLVGLLCATMK